MLNGHCILHVLNEYIFMVKMLLDMEKWWSPTFSPFSRMISTLPSNYTIIYATFELLSVSSLNLDQSRIFSVCKERSHDSLLTSVLCKQGNACYDDFLLS